MPGFKGKYQLPYFCNHVMYNFLIYSENFLIYGHRKAVKIIQGKFLRVKTNFPEMELFYRTDDIKQTLQIATCQGSSGVEPI